jgi:uncharacterized membrane protein YdjX (TVP38/TMEM64 family)
MWKPILWVTAVVSIPVIPLLGFGSAVEEAIARWLREEQANWVIGVAVILVLSLDVFLPIPSSAVSTIAGRMAGWFPGTLFSWIGMMLGALLGFALARWGGRPLAQRFSDQVELDRLDGLARRHGIWILILLRPVPVLAEASTLLMGLSSMRWAKFLLAVGPVNLFISLCFVALGQSIPLLPAMVLSVFVALGISYPAKKWLLPNQAAEEAENESSSKEGGSHVHHVEHRLPGETE